MLEAEGTVRKGGLHAAPCGSRRAFTGAPSACAYACVPVVAGTLREEGCDMRMGTSDGRAGGRRAALCAL